MLVTDMWVERCLYRKKFEEPQAKVTNTPFPKFPILGFEALTVCSTGFQGIDLVHMSKTVKLMSATYDEIFTPKASVLLCNAVIPGHEKLIHAQVWGVPAVKAEWLWDCVRRGEFMPFGSYLVQPLRDPNQVSRNAESHNSQDKSAKSRKSEKLLGNTVMTSKRQNRQPLPPAEEEGKRLANDTPSSSEQVQVIDPNPWSTTTTTGPSHANKKQSPDANTTNDTTLSNHSNLDSESSHTLRPTSGPLHEISPNTSQSKGSTSPEKVPEPGASAQTMPSPQKPDSTSSSSLGPAISSLLAHHQRASTNHKTSASSTSSEQPHPYRRRRQLLGRAPSNLSSHSINLSRASSVDTMNTDGLGTPLESCNINKSEDTKTNNNNHNDNNNNDNNNNSNNNNDNSNNNPPQPAEPKPMWSAATHDHEDPDREEPPLPMTQLGYEDENVKAWRETVDVKMGVVVVPAGYGKAAAAAKGKGATTTTPGKAKSRDVGGGLGISRRTRLATTTGR